MADYVEQATKLGYEVDVAFEAEDADGNKVTVYRVKGQGMDTMYREDQEDEWKYLVNPDAHEHREKMYRHNLPSVEEAKKMGENVEGDDFKMTEEEIVKSAMKASVSAGLLTQEQANEQMKTVLPQKPA